nr:glycyl radical enzyme domain-containing protein [Vibrio tapetis]
MYHRVPSVTNIPVYLGKLDGKIIGMTPFSEPVQLASHSKCLVVQM